jgi:hypothetical protein
VANGISLPIRNPIEPAILNQLEMMLEEPERRVHRHRREAADDDQQ